MQRTTLVSILGALAALALMGAQTQAPAPAPSPVTHSATAELVGKIVSIDQTNRIVTLQDAKGNVQSVQVAPSVTRFSALKVGDTVTIRYEESVELAIVKAGASPSAQTSPTVTESKAPGEKPGGSVTKTTTTTVTIKAIDQTTPSVTVLTQDGRTVTMLVHDRQHLALLHVGDVVRITYTKAVAISVK